jgi:predicted peptidase
MKYFIVTVLGVLLFANSSNAQLKQRYEAGHYSSNGDTLSYRVLYPLNFDEEKKYPLVLFLHGAGERGDDNKRQLIHGSNLFTNQNNREEFPAIVVFPQCPKDDYWSNVIRTTDQLGKREFDYSQEGPPTKALSLVIGLVDSLSGAASVDSQRIYVSGLSMGGMGTFEIIKRRPDMFAAAMPICGGGNPLAVASYAKKVSFWVFHGAKDNVVSPHHSIAMVQALQLNGADVGFNLYANDNHNSWDSAFEEPTFLAWMFSKKKP